jgi:hypothetical protein
MRGMKHATASQSHAREASRASVAGTDSAKKAYGDHYLPPTTLPDLVGSGPILPEWLRKLFRRTDRPTAR